MTNVEITTELMWIYQPRRGRIQKCQEANHSLRKYLVALLEGY